MQKRFVIHLHGGYGRAHYDLMLERGDCLATWQLSQSPAELAEGQSAPARRIGDHRLVYLDYEGEVSRGRGNVTRFDSGTCEILSADESRWEFRLAGNKLRGLFELKPTKGSEGWTLARLSGPRPRRS